MCNKKAYLISCSDHYRHRLEILDRFLQSRGYETQYITSDFDHTEKKFYTCSVPNCVQLHVPPYQKNISVGRAFSHWLFAKKVYRYLEGLPEAPDLLVTLLPPNALAHYTARYKKKHPQVTLLMDLFDLWPETLPISASVKKLLFPVFRTWSGLRDRNLGKADFITSECELFLSKLNLSREHSAPVYLCRPLSQVPAPCLAEDRLELCYLGAINNIIGIDDICNLLRQLVSQKPVTLHIIGKGEQKDTFLRAARETGAQVEFYGAVYDEDKIQEILSHCHFGLNIMRSSVCVGLTMKSMDYFRAGLPIINSIPADTAHFIRKYGVGIQLDDSCAKKILQCDSAQFLALRENTLAMYRELFTPEVILRAYETHLGNLL